MPTPPSRLTTVVAAPTASVIPARVEPKVHPTWLCRRRKRKRRKRRKRRRRRRRS